jgi:hypothetical protein
MPPRTYSTSNTICSAEFEPNNAPDYGGRQLRTRTRWLTMSQPTIERNQVNAARTQDPELWNNPPAGQWLLPTSSGVVADWRTEPSRRIVPAFSSSVIQEKTNATQQFTPPLEFLVNYL